MPARRVGGRPLFVSSLLALALLVASCGGGKGSDNTSGDGTSNGSSSEACSLQGTDFTSDDSWSGDAFVEVTSDQTVDASLTFNVYRVDAPFLVEFEDDNGQSLLICGGDSFTGSRQTSDSLGVGVHVGTASLTSSSGECTVDMAQMTLDGIDGTFDCPEFVDETQPDVTFAVTGTFSAANPFADDVLP